MKKIATYKPYNSIMSNTFNNIRSLMDSWMHDFSGSQLTFTSFDEDFDGVEGVEYVDQEDGSLSLLVSLPEEARENELNMEIHNNGLLTIKSERITENSTYSFTKSFSLPEGYDFDNIVAEMKNGKLQLSLKPLSLPEPKKITLKG